MRVGVCACVVCVYFVKQNLGDLVFRCYPGVSGIPKSILVVKGNPAVGLGLLICCKVCRIICSALSVLLNDTTRQHLPTNDVRKASPLS